MPTKRQQLQILMQKALVIVTEATESRRKDFEIVCCGDHICLCFWSGSRGNQIVVQVANNEIFSTNIRQTWRE